MTQGSECTSRFSGWAQGVPQGSGLGHKEYLDVNVRARGVLQGSGFWESGRRNAPFKSGLEPAVHT